MANPDWRRNFAIEPREVSIKDYRPVSAQEIKLKNATFKLPQVNDTKLSTTQSGAVYIWNDRFYVMILPLAHVSRNVDELLEKTNQNIDTIKRLFKQGGNVKVVGLPPDKVRREDLKHQVDLFGMPGSYEQALRYAKTLPLPMVKVVFMSSPDLERYMAWAFGKAIEHKTGLGLFSSPRVHGIMTYGLGDSGRTHASVWQLDGSIGQGIYYLPKSKDDLDPLYMMLDTLTYLPEEKERAR